MQDEFGAPRDAVHKDGDGKLTIEDARYGLFRVLVTNADGSTTAQTLAALGITEIDLRPDTTRIELPDGSVITWGWSSTGGTGAAAGGMLRVSHGGTGAWVQ